MSQVPLPEILEQKEQAEIILRTALNRLRAMGYAVETHDDDGKLIWIHKLTPVFRGKVLDPLVKDIP